MDPSSDLSAALFAVQSVLDEEGIEHALCGGIAANLYRKEVKATTDVDVYVVSSPPKVLGLARSFEKRGWRAHPAWRKGELLRLEHDELPRVDLLVASTELERQAVARAVPAQIEDRQIRVLRPEDLIVFKLVAGRARDYEAAVAIINARDLDTAFIEAALAEIGFEDRWTRALEWAELDAEDRG